MAGGLFFLFLKWHFLVAPRAMLRAWGNILWFYLHYFSVGYLLKTLLSPWRKYQWNYGKGFNPGRFAEALFSNLVSRMLGGVIRLGIIAAGLVTDAILLAAAGASILVWIFLPLLIFLALVYGFIVLF